MLPILLLHMLLVLLFGSCCLYIHRLSIKDYASWLLLLMFPFGGILIFIILQLLNTISNQDDPLENLSEYEQDAPVFELIEPLDIKSETDIASLEETLLIADYSKRREVILNLLKEDTADRVSYIDLALRNEDSETAHYAASGILHTKRKLDSSLSVFSELYRNDPNDMVVAFTYADLLRQYLSTVRLDPVDRLFYVYENIHVLEKIVQNSDQARTAQLIYLIDLMLETENFNKTQTYCDILENNHPDSEEKYLTLLKSFFLMKDRQHFERIFNQFRNSNIHFSSETMKVIRLWLGAISRLRTSV